MPKNDLLTVDCDVEVDVLVTTLTVEGGIVVLTEELLELLDCVVTSTVVVVAGLVEARVVTVEIVVGAVACCVVWVAICFGSKESTTPIGPLRSTSDSGHDSSSD